jgi:hypothetical protein
MHAMRWMRWHAVACGGMPSHARMRWKSMAAPADGVIEQGIVFAKPMHIGDQRLGRSAFTLIANIDDHQARSFDTRGRTLRNASPRTSCPSRPAL